MTYSAEVSEIIGKQFPVLDHGFVALIDVMGDDAAIVQAARVSYGKGTKTISQDAGLIRYLMRHRHTTPFEMVELKFLVKLPIFVARQWIRHRTASVNEYSARYSILEDEFYIPDVSVVAEQSAVNKQGRGDALDVGAAEEVRNKIRDNNERTYALYEYLLNEDAGEEGKSPADAESRGSLARELARIVIPTNVYTQWYWKIDLHNLFHFLSLRLDAHAQYEIRQYAQVMADMTRAAAPIAYKAFEDYRLNAVSLTGPEIAVLRLMVKEDFLTDPESESFITLCTESGLTNNRELTEFKEKLARLFPLS